MVGHMNKLVGALALLVTVSGTSVLLFRSVGGAQEGPKASSSVGTVVAVVNGTEIPVVEGSVVLQVPKVNGNCEVTSPLGVGGIVRDGELPPVITWSFDRECRMVITSIEEGHDTPNPTIPVRAVPEGLLP